MIAWTHAVNLPANRNALARQAGKTVKYKQTDTHYSLFIILSTIFIIQNVKKHKN